MRRLLAVFFLAQKMAMDLRSLRGEVRHMGLGDEKVSHEWREIYRKTFQVKKTLCKASF